MAIGPLIGTVTHIRLCRLVLSNNWRQFDNLSGRRQSPASLLLLSCHVTQSAHG